MGIGLITMTPEALAAWAALGITVVGFLGGAIWALSKLVNVVQTNTEALNEIREVISGHGDKIQDHSERILVVETKLEKK